MSSSGFSLHQCKGFLPVPFSRHFPIFAGAAGLTLLASYLNGRNFRPVESMGPEFKAEEAKGIATRTDAPAVFLNPVSSGLPGGILGPDDIANRG
jgi:hypothetical protein